MEINKVLFTDSVNLNSIGTSTNTEKADLQTSLSSYTEGIDESSQLIQKESTQASRKNECGLTQTDQEHFEQDITNSKGTTYLVIGNIPACGNCVKLENAINERLDEFEEQAQIYSIQWKDKTQNNSVFCKHILNELNTNQFSFPIVVKFVDGKPIEVVTEGKSESIYWGKNMDSVVQEMLDKAEGAPPTVVENTKKTAENQIKEENKIQNEEQTSDTTKITAKQKLETMKENLQIMNNFVQEITTDALENAIENASSMSELKDAINNYSAEIDFNLQINLQSFVNSLSEDSKLDRAKEQLLEML